MWPHPVLWPQVVNVILPCDPGSLKVSPPHKLWNDFTNFLLDRTRRSVIRYFLQPPWPHLVQLKLRGEKQLLIFKGVVSDVWSYFKADWETVGLQSHSSPCTIEEFKLLPYWERVYHACHPALFLPQKPHKEVKKQIWYLTVNHLARRLRWDDVKHCSSTLNSLAQASAPFDAMETICTV